MNNGYVTLLDTIEVKTFLQKGISPSLKRLAADFILVKHMPLISSSEFDNTNSYGTSDTAFSAAFTLSLSKQ